MSRGASTTGLMRLLTYSGAIGHVYFAIIPNRRTGFGIFAMMPDDMPLLLKPSGTPEPRDHILFFPTAASQNPDGTWHVPIHGWIFRPTARSRLRRTALATAALLLRRRIRKTPEGT